MVAGQIVARAEHVVIKVRYSAWLGRGRLDHRPLPERKRAADDGRGRTRRPRRRSGDPGILRHRGVRGRPLPQRVPRAPSVSAAGQTPTSTSSSCSARASWTVSDEIPSADRRHFNSDDRAYALQSPPNWPPVPPEWTPRPCWPAARPVWPPPPPGWPLWVAEDKSGAHRADPGLGGAVLLIAVGAAITVAGDPRRTDRRPGRRPRRPPPPRLSPMRTRSSRSSSSSNKPGTGRNSTTCAT